MALATRCPNCHALFRVAADQLKLRGGLVRCGACQHVFDATGTLSYIDDATLSTSAHPAAPAVGAVIAAIRKAESSASEAISASAPPRLSAQANALSPADEPASAAPPLVAAAVITEDALEAAAPASAPAFAGDDRDAPAAAASGAELRGADESATEPPATEETLPIDEPATPEFLRQADSRKKRRRAVPLAVGAIALALLLLAQLAAAFRAEILVRLPQARPALTGLCKVFRCTVDWPARGDLLAVVGSELQALPGTGAFELTAIVRNRGNTTLALPAIELTLSDTLNRTVARKVFAPADYLAGDGDPQARLLAGLEAGADLTVRITFEARELNAAGFVVYPFYL